MKPVHALVAGFCLLLSTGVYAQITCNVSTVGIAFGAYNPTSSLPLDGSGSVSVSCTNSLTGSLSVSYTISLNQGNGTFNARKLVSGPDSLLYNVYTTSQRNQIWGDGSNGTSTVAGGGTMLTTFSSVHTTYGRITEKQNVPAGTYSDTLTVTLTY